MLVLKGKKRWSGQSWGWNGQALGSCFFYRKARKGFLSRLRFKFAKLCK